MASMKTRFLDALSMMCDYPCPATQDAIDRLAAEFGRGRSWLLEMLSDSYANFTDRDLLLLLTGNVWDDRTVILATTRTRESWIALLNSPSDDYLTNEEIERRYRARFAA